MLSSFETMLGRPRCRTWIPLATQQLRLRHLIRVIAYNIKTAEGSLYYTLHLTTMCAPFYTSEKLESQNPKWAELDVNTLQFSSGTGVVLRIWQHRDTAPTDTVILAWGICLPGLVYLGTKLADIQPVSFKQNSVIFQLNGGFFTSQHCIRVDPTKPLPFIEHVNVVNNGETTSIIRNASIKCAKSDVRLSYNVKKLQRLHSLQQSIKNKSLDAQELREKISGKCGLIEGNIDTSSPLRETSQPDIINQTPRFLSMTSLSRLLNNKQDQPTRIQRQEIAKIRKLIESARFRTKLLAQERDRKLANIRWLNNESNVIQEFNEDKNSELMALYRQLSRDVERLRERRRSQADIRELYVHTSAQLQLARKQLVNELLLIYPIIKFANNTYTISGVHLPDAEKLNTVPENSLSVALGFVTHVVIMCSVFLQVPLRYPLVHLGSRSKITDHITYNFPDKDREFPLYTKGKERLQFHYAVFLLNKNIAQLRWTCGLPTQDLAATLPNLLSLLQGTGDFRYDRSDSGFNSRCMNLSDPNIEPTQLLTKKYGSFSTLEPSLGLFNERLMLSTPISNSCEQIFKNDLAQNVSPIRRISRNIVSESGPGLSQILAPGNGFKLSQRFRKDDNCDTKTSSCVDCNIEQGLDMLDSSNLCSSQNEHSLKNELKSELNGTEPLDLAIKLKRRISRSVGSYTDDEKFSLKRSEVGSDSILINSDHPETNLSDQSLPNSLGEGRKEFLQHWFNSSPALVCSEEHLCPEEYLGVTSHEQEDEDGALTSRTEALVEQNSTFHLVRPKH